MADILLNRNVSPSPDIPFNISMHGLPPATSSSDSHSGRIYYRFEDEPDKEPQLFGKVSAGFSLDRSIDLKGRAIRLYLISETKKGILSTKDFAQAVQTLFDPGAAAVGPEETVIAGANLAANELVYFYDDSGTTKADKADATDATKPCQGFVVVAATTGNPVRIFLGGNKMTGLTGKTQGANQYLSTTPGAMSESVVTANGNLNQKIGTATGTTIVDFNPETGAPIVVGGGTPLPPNALALTDLGPSGGHESVKLDWTNNGGTGDNIIERDFNGGGFLAHATVAYNVATYTDSPLISLGPDVSYRVRNASVLGYSNVELITI